MRPMCAARADLRGLGACPVARPRAARRVYANMRPTMKSTNARSFGDACRPDGHST